MRRNVKLIVFVSIIWMFFMVYYFQSNSAKFQKGAPESDLDAPRSSEAPATPISEINSIGSLSRNSSTRKRKGISNKDATTEVIALVGKKLESLQAEDEFQVFGKHVANKLRNVNSEQNIVAQKLISHILFEAGMGSLNRNFRMVDMSVRQQDNFATLSGQNICLQNVPREWDSAYSQYQILVNSTPQSGTPKRRVSEEFPSHRDYTTIGEYTNTFDEN